MFSIKNHQDARALVSAQIFDRLSRSRGLFNSFINGSILFFFFNSRISEKYLKFHSRSSTTCKFFSENNCNYEKMTATGLRNQLAINFYKNGIDDEIN